MTRLSILACAVVAALVAAAPASAQMIPPGASVNSPPPPAALPPPKIEVPVAPQMGEVPSQPSVRPSTRGSFSDRVSKCLDEGAAAGLSPNKRAAYSRACANR